MALEIEREIKCCHANPVMKQVYEWCTEHGKRIIIISDMYLPVEVVREILTSCGYEGWEKLYLSSESGYRKNTGRLFKYAVRDSGLDPKKHVHIGDSWRGDYFRALLAGMSAYKITRYPVMSKYSGTMGLTREGAGQYGKYQRVINNNIAPGWDEYYQYGFEVVGMMLYGLCCWLHERFAENKHDKVFFLSRDGWMMREAYNELFGDRAVNNGYLYVSRNSLLLPRLWMNPSLANALEFVTTFEFLDVNQLCDILDIDTAQAYKVWQDCGLALDEKIIKKLFINDERVNKFFGYFKEDIIRRSREKFELLISYLKQEEFKGSVAVIDIGWAGSMQNFLGECVASSDIDAAIHGYYLGLKPKIFIASSSAESYIPVELMPCLFCPALMEYPFTKIDGSTKSYTSFGNGTVIPVLYDYEFEGTDDKFYTAQVQKGTMDFISLMSEGYGTEHVDYPAAYARMRKVTKSPSMREAVLLGNIHYINHGRIEYLAKPAKFLQYILHPGRLKVDFVGSGWKMGFLKRLLKISLPYDKFLHFLRSLLEKRYS